MAFKSLIGTMQREVATSIDSGRARLPDFWVAIVSAMPCTRLGPPSAFDPANEACREPCDH
jgi:hypothetical protein